MEQGYRDYEYKTVTAYKQDAGQIANRYASLGWELDSQTGSILSAVLTFKRERGVRGREQLNRLEARIEDCADGVRRLEERKAGNATMALVIPGIIFALVLGGGLSLCLLNPPAASLAFIGGLVLGVAGLGLGALVYPFYRRFSVKNAAKIDPLIEKKKDELADLCRDAHAIITNNV